MKSWQEIFSHRVAFIPDAGCWLFEGAWTSAGYGNSRIDSMNWLAHRLSYALLVGPLSKTDVLCHRCDTPACVNPAHLFVGSLKDNSMDMARKQRHNHGERHHMARLNVSAVREIRGCRLSDMELAKKFGVSRAAVTYARNGTTWKQVTADHGVRWSDPHFKQQEAA